MSRPVTCGWTDGVVWPPAIVTAAGEMESFPGALLLRFTVTPPEGAAVPRVTGNATVVLRPMFALAGRPMDPGELTVTEAVAFAMFGVDVLAVMVACPAATGVTG